MRVFLFGSMILWLLATTGLAQSSAQLTPNYTPQTPNAASLGRFGEHPVNLFTGVPSISIPVHEIVAGAIRVPISLDYHAGGIKVTDMASWVGLGWALNGAGSITRAVTGRPDEKDGMLSRPLNTTLTNQGSSPQACENVIYEYDQYLNEVWDTGYDIFSFSLPGGKSGKFILVPDGSGSMVTTMPLSRMRITYTRTGPGDLSKFTIVDEDGITYIFDRLESVANNSNNAVTSAWYVSQIIGVRSNDIVRFSYRFSQFNGYTDFTDRINLIETAIGACSESAGNQTPLPQVQQIPLYASLLLESVTFPGGKLDFVAGTQRLDVPSTGSGSTPALSRIDLYSLRVSDNTYQLQKRIALNQSYYSVNSANTYNNSNGPLRLDGVALQDADGREVGRYNCTYNADMLPGFLSKSRDIWGYYNGQSNNTLIPRQTVPVYYDGGSTMIPVGDANRNSSESYMKVGTLTQLSYPTGGTTRFSYESNRYMQGSTPQLAGGLRISRIETQASANEPARVKTYKYGVNGSGYGDLNVNLSSNGWSYAYKEKVSPDCERGTRVFGSYYNGITVPYDGSPVTYSEVTEYEGTYENGNLVEDANGRTVHKFRTGGDLQFGIGNNASKKYVASYHWNRGQLESKTAYARNSNTPVYKLVNTWGNPVPVNTSVSSIGVLVDRYLTYTSSWLNANPNAVPSQCERLNRGYSPPRFYPWPSSNNVTTRPGIKAGGRITTVESFTL